MKLTRDLMTAVRELVALIGADEVHEIEVERGLWGQGKVRIVRTGGPAPIVSAVAPSAAISSDVSAQNLSSDAVLEQEADAGAEDESNYHTVLSPMVGMFYSAPNPDSPSYVQEDDVVSTGQTVCIIEAMKIMNEIESDADGRVVRVLVENATPVEYNTPLFLVDPQA